MTNKNKMNIDDFIRLTLMRLRGAMAAELLKTESQPTDKQLDALYKDDPTMRDISDFAHSVGKQADFEIIQGGTNNGF